MFAVLYFHLAFIFASPQMRPSAEESLHKNANSYDLNSRAQSDEVTQQLAPASTAVSLADSKSTIPLKLQGTKLREYESKKLLGEGADGYVYLYEKKHSLTERLRSGKKSSKLAVKKVLADKWAYPAIPGMEENHLAKKLNLIALKPELQGGTLNIVMKHFKGKSLEEAVDGASPQEALKLYDNLLSALSKLEKTGVQHGDLHLGNMIVASNGKIQIIDFSRGSETVKVKNNDYFNEFGLYKDRLMALKLFRDALTTQASKSSRSGKQKDALAYNDLVKEVTVQILVAQNARQMSLDKLTPDLVESYRKIYRQRHDEYIKVKNNMESIKVMDKFSQLAYFKKLKEAAKIVRQAARESHSLQLELMDKMRLNGAEKLNPISERLDQELHAYHVTFQYAKNKVDELAKDLNKSK